MWVALYTVSKLRCDHIFFPTSLERRTKDNIVNARKNVTGAILPSYTLSTPSFKIRPDFPWACDLEDKLSEVVKADFKTLVEQPDADIKIDRVQHVIEVFSQVHSDHWIPRDSEEDRP